MNLSRYALRTAGFAALYLLATLAGQATAMETGGIHLLWPAAPVAAVWLVAQARYRLRRFDVIAVGTVAAAAAVLSHSFLAALVQAGAQVVPALLFAWMLDRWLPGYWLGHGDRFRRLPTTLTRLAATAAMAGAATAVLQGVLLTASLSPLEAGYLFLRDTTAILLTVLLVRTTHQRLTTRTRSGRLTVVR
ncbi:MAG: hypothetical protein ABW022_01525 [Actinoplanes sp.]